MLEFINAKNIVGWLLIWGGCLDAYKYVIQGIKIKKAQSARNVSRRFVNYAIICDVLKIVYSVIIMDFYIFVISAIAIFCMAFMWYELYLWYPYRHRGLLNFKRPNIIHYLINSIVPNRIRKRL